MQGRGTLGRLALLELGPWHRSPPALLLDRPVSPQRKKGCGGRKHARAPLLLHRRPEKSPASVSLPRHTHPAIPPPAPLNLALLPSPAVRARRAARTPAVRAPWRAAACPGMLWGTGTVLALHGCPPPALQCQMSAATPAPAPARGWGGKSDVPVVPPGKLWQSRR